MTSIPDNPKEQFLFFIDNPIVAGEPGGKALIEGFLALVAPLIGGGGEAASSAMAALFDDELFAASAPVEGAPAGDSGGKGGGHHGDDAGAALGLALGLLGGFARRRTRHLNRLERDGGQRPARQGLMALAGEDRVDVLDVPAARQAADHARADPLEAELLLDAERGRVVVEDAGADDVEAELAEQEGEEGAAGFGRVALAPGRFRQPIAELALAPDPGEAQAADHAAIVGDGERDVPAGCLAGRGEEALGVGAGDRGRGRGRASRTRRSR